MADASLGLRQRSWPRRVAAFAAGGAVVSAVVLPRVLPERPVPPVTEAEARAFLDRAVALGLAGDFDRLCKMNGSAFNCHMTLDTGVIHTPPKTPPNSVTAVYAENGNGNDTPGWVLTVRGLDGAGKRYRTEVMVFRDHERSLKGVNIVWWSGARVALREEDMDVIEAPATD